MGRNYFLEKLSDPYWFQSFGCVLGFDWHSSGLTTTVCAALKEGLRDIGRDLGIFVCGGKGATSRKTPQDIIEFSSKNKLKVDTEKLVYASKMSAKVDNTAVQDGFQLYQHCFIFTHAPESHGCKPVDEWLSVRGYALRNPVEKEATAVKPWSFTEIGKWVVIQQGLNENTRWARRYHWLSNQVSDFVCEPHTAICCDYRVDTLNMVAKESDHARETSKDIANSPTHKVVDEFRKMINLDLPRRHEVLLKDIKPNNLNKILIKTYERHPNNFQELLSIEGVGPKTIRALALISELIYGVKPSYRDPVKFSFAHGGKDGYPYHISRLDYDKSIEVLRKAISDAKIGIYDKMRALKRLSKDSKRVSVG